MRVGLCLDSPVNLKLLYSAFFYFVQILTLPPVYRQFVSHLVNSKNYIFIKLNEYWLCNKPLGYGLISIIFLFHILTKESVPLWQLITLENKQ